MGFKLVRIDKRLDGSNATGREIVLSFGSHNIGRGSAPLNCTDHRVSRKHAEMIVNSDAILLRSLHQNPCFFKKNACTKTVIFSQPETCVLSNGDEFGLTPDKYWYKVVNCIEDSPTNFGESESERNSQNMQESVEVKSENVFKEEVFEEETNIKQEHDLNDPALINEFSDSEVYIAAPEMQTSPENESENMETVISDLEKLIDQPDESINNAGKSINQPDKSMDQINASIDQPDESIDEPDVRIHQPDTSIDQPDESIVKPDVPIHQPDTSIDQPDESIDKPDVPICHPDTSIDQPDESIDKPDVPLCQPDTSIDQPDESNDEPDVPICQPDTSIDQPDESINEPNVPIHHPDESINEPNVPIHHPDTSIDQPDESIDEPDVPMHQPDTSIGQPDVLIDKPDESNQPNEIPIDNVSTEHVATGKRTHLQDSSPCPIKRVKTEPESPTGDIGDVTRTLPNPADGNTATSDKPFKAEPESPQDTKPQDVQAGPSNNQGGSSNNNNTPPLPQARPNKLRERCMYGASCYRRNPQHLATYSHPADADWGSGARAPCPWGAACRRADPRHRRDHEHPPRADRPGKKRQRRRRHSASSNESDSGQESLIVTGKRQRKLIVRQGWSDSGDEDPYKTDDSDEWEPPSDVTSQEFSQSQDQ